MEMLPAPEYFMCYYVIGSSVTKFIKNIVIYSCMLPIGLETLLVLGVVARQLFLIHNS